MGYQITFKPTEEKMEEYKKSSYLSMKELENSYKSVKRELVSICLKGDDEAQKHNIETEIQFKINYLVSLVRNIERLSAYERWKEDDNKELWYCGWRFARDCDMDKDSLVDDTVEKLYILADVVKTPDYFNESERFYDKWNEIKEEIEGLRECLEDVFIHEIIEELREFEVKYNDEEEQSESDDKTI